MMQTAQITCGLGLMVVGFWFYIDAFKRSARFSPDAGALRVGLSCCAIGCGGLLVVFAVA